MEIPEVGFGFGPVLMAHTTRRGLVICWRAIPLGAYVRVPGMTRHEKVAVPEERTFRAASTPRRIAVAAAGVTVNLVLAVLLLTGATVGRPVPVAGSTVVHPGQTGVPVGATVTAVQTVQDQAGFPAATPLSLEVSLSDSRGLPVRLVWRDGSRHGVATAPVERGGPTGWTIPGLTVEQSVTHLGLVPGIAHAVQANVAATGQITSATAAFATPHGVSAVASQIAGHKGGGATARPMSVIGIVNVAGQAARHSWRDYLAMLALISLALALINALPAPPLDGGYIAIAIYEGIRSRLAGERRYVGNAAISTATALVIGVLGAMSVAAMWLDIVRPIHLHLGG
jgi:membrane-associated protease RseP (regulator of RpoE activity)